MQSRGDQRQKPRTPPSMVIDAEAVGFSVGDQVTHPKFGEGTVMGIAEDTLTIQFEAGFKNVKAGYVQPVGAEDDVPF